jgi:hypothetical protein
MFATHCDMTASTGVDEIRMAQSTPVLVAPALP